MGLSFFKLKKVSGEPYKKRDTKKFTFKLDDTIDVVKYYFVPNNSVSVLYSDLCGESVFMSSKINCTLVDGEKIYPIFQTPKTLPTVKLVTPKKVICIGSILVTDQNEIVQICDDYTGSTLEDILHEFKLKPFTAYEHVILMLRDFIVNERPVMEGIDYDTFERFITVKNTLELVMYDE